MTAQWRAVNLDMIMFSPEDHEYRNMHEAKSKKEDEDEKKPLLLTSDSARYGWHNHQSDTSTLYADQSEQITSSSKSESASSKYRPNEDVVNGDEENNSFTIRHLPRRKKLVVALLVLSNFFDGCGFSLLAPFFPQEAEKKGVSNTVTGLIFSSFELMIFVSSPIFGNYLTRIGPKFMFVVGLLVGGFCAILFGTLDRCPPGTPFIIVCFACRCIEALGLSAFMTAGFAIISNEFPKHVATVFALLETAGSIGLMAGPALGGALYELGGFGLPFFVIGSLILATGASMLLFLPQPQDRHEERKVSIFSLLKSPMIWFTGQAIVVASIGILFLDPTLSKHLQQFDLSTAVIGLIFVISPGLYGLTSPMWGYISDSKKLRGSLIFLGNLMCGIAFLFIGPSPYLPFLPDELWVTIVGLVIMGIFSSLAVVPTMNCLLMGAAELGFEDNLDTYGVIAGLFNSIFCLGSFTGPMLGGILIEDLGFSYGATVISGIYFFVMISCGSYFLYRLLSERSTPVIPSVHYESIKSSNEGAKDLTEDTPVV